MLDRYLSVSCCAMKITGFSICFDELMIGGCEMFNQVEGKNAKREAKRQREREKARREVTAEMSEDFSEGEKADLPGEIPTLSDNNTKGRMSRISSVDVFENWFAQHKEKKLYIVLIRYRSLLESLCVCSWGK